MKKFLRLIIAVGLGSFFVGCKQDVVNSFGFSFQDGKAGFGVEFSPDFTISAESRSPIGKYGEVAFIPGNGTDYGIKFDASLNVGAYLDATIIKTKETRLPNGAPFPSYIGSALYRYEFVKNTKFSGNAYFGADVGKRYLGTAIAINELTNGIPAGFSLTQSLLNSNKERVGVATVYGPVVANGNVIAPGGVFGAINLSTTVPNIEDFISGKKLTSDLNSLVISETYEAAGDIEVWTADGRTLTDEEVVDILLAFNRALKSSKL
jgi:hypothetical protein